VKDRLVRRDPGEALPGGVRRQGFEQVKLAAVLAQEVTSGDNLGEALAVSPLNRLLPDLQHLGISG
jgi:hypothetical protein